MLNKMLTQKEILALLTPILRERGQLFQKFQPVFAKKADSEQEVLTYTSDGLETKNTALPGDFIVQNQTRAEEQYVIQAKKFHQLYKLKKRSAGEFQEYDPKGKVWAVEVDDPLLRQLRQGTRIDFMAKWDAPMAAKLGDFLVADEKMTEVYRIAKNEFHETYRPVTA